MDSSVLAVLIPIAVVGGFLRGFAGFGGPLFMLPILNGYFSPAVSIAVMMWVDIFSNAHLLPEARRHSSWEVVIPMTIGTLIGMPIGAYLLLQADPILMKKVISATILVAALVLLTGWRYPRPLGPRTLGGLGGFSGLVMGATAIAAVTPVFLAASSHSAAQNRANFIIWVFFATVLLIALLMWNGTLGTGDAATILILTPAYLVGTVLGSRSQRGASEVAVRRVVLLLVVVVATVGLFQTT